MLNPESLDLAYEWIALGDRHVDRHAIVVAVSGGSDSVALLLTLQDWQRRSAPELALIAVTVDHCLRPESAAEARSVGALCAARGIRHRILCWQEAKAGSGVTARAREARYNLLAQAADEAGTDIILTGHTADDQAETVFMRRQRGDGPGLSGMAPATLRAGRFWIVRPLLGQRRAALRNLLTAEGIGWIDDPTNEDPAHERVRARQRLANDPALAAEMLALARDRARRRVAEARLQADQIERGARLAAPGLLRLDRAFLEQDHAGALRVLLACIGGTEFLPGTSETLRLQQAVRDGGAFALSRALVVPAGDALFVHRELRNLPEADVDGVYDGRFRVSASGWRLRRNGAPAGTGLEARARATVPLVEARANKAGSAGEKAVPVPVLAPFEAFLSGYDLPVANAAARLFGRAAFPEPPVPCAEF